MKKRKGYHFYVNIKNLNQIMIDEETKTGEVNHTLHALDTYFSSIESYGKRKYPDIFFVEKITGSRLHMYVIDDFKISFPVVNDISVYAFILANYLNKGIYRYKTLLDFKIQVGSCYGEFYNFMFETENYTEETTIGYVANFSAKLQSLAKEGNIAVSLNVYESMNSDLKGFFSKTIDESLIKYEQTCYYCADLSEFASEYEYNNELELANKKSNEVNLSDIVNRKAYTKISFDSLSKKECKDVQGIPLFADIRGFTQKFEKDDSNLEDMTHITKDVLSTMYFIVREKGIHVQFQGDREFALFHNYGQYDCCKDAVIAGLKLIDAIRTKGYAVTIGVGQSIGRMFVSKIGARGEKDNIVLGETVTIADQNEDKYAKENQLVISEEIYAILKSTQNSLANLFNKEKDYYKTEVGYKEFCDVVSYEYLKMNNKRNNYNGAWAE